MKITLMQGANIYHFNVVHNNKNYSVTVWTKNSGKFMDWEVIDKSGGEVTMATEDEIINGIDKHWENLNK